MNRLKKGDQVYIISGKNKGKMGTVSSIVNNERILVDGINLAKKHVKPNPNKNETGGIIEKEMPIHISNLAYYDVASKKGVKLAFSFNEKKEKIRINRKSKKEV